MKKKRIHFIGIGGYGMSAIARVLVEQGLDITGSDIECNAAVKMLMEKGVKVAIGHDAHNIAGADLVVYSSSILPGNVEIQAAKKHSMIVWHRSDMLSYLLKQNYSVVVAGAHGKTTTSSMIAHTMVECGLDPTYVIGGEVVSLRNNAQAGKGPHIVAEADESDGSFLSYVPQMAVITNIEADHLENYGGDFQQLKDAYCRFLKQVPVDGIVILCSDDPHLMSIIDHARCNVITYSIENKTADYRVVSAKHSQQGICFSVSHNDQILGAIELSKPGIYNAANALASTIVCLKLGISFYDISLALNSFAGAKRRFQVLGEERGIVIVDDYAHHPTEIEVTLEAARLWKNEIRKMERLLILFQPQRYSRTSLFMDRFAACFKDASKVFIAPIYAPPGEEPLEGITSMKLVDKILHLGNDKVQLVENHDDAFNKLLQIVREGDIVLTMGAGDIWRVAHRLLGELKK